MVLWSQEKYLIWDTTCTDTLYPSNLQHASKVLGGAATMAKKAKKAKNLKYDNLECVYQFQPIAMETCNTLGPDSQPFLKELGRRLRMATGEPKSYVFLLQHLSVTIQTGNATSVMGSIPVSSLIIAIIVIYLLLCYNIVVTFIVFICVQTGGSPSWWTKHAQGGNYIIITTQYNTL